LNIDNLGKTYSVAHAADLAEMLPYESRTNRAMHPSNVWGWQEWLLRDIANSLRGFAGKNAKFIEIPWEKVKTDYALDIDEYQRKLKMPRKEVPHG